MNKVILIGRLARDPEMRTTPSGVATTSFTIAVQRSYKNAEGVYETDFIKCTLWNGIAENTAEYCKKGDVVGVKGRLQCLSGNELQVVAEKVSFLSSRKEEDRD